LVIYWAVTNNKKYRKKVAPYCGAIFFCAITIIIFLRKSIMGAKLKADFFERIDVVAIARALIGKELVTSFNGIRTSGIIVETEAYAGVHDKASHAYNNRRTTRTEPMYAKGGTAYVYLCYGIHHLFNVVTNKEGTPHAVLIRALQPKDGIDEMLRRRGKSVLDYSLTKGPGSVSKALGICTRHTGKYLVTDSEIWLEEGMPIHEEIISSSRIGVDYAGEDALMPYRFYVKNNKNVSGKIKPSAR
jgi:DNA-3-methyladenine glycosylase